ncbi:hypothetical protein [Streptacidiphilus sp. MAP5-52]|uniref:hypothetical protein n=1 Tax=Streptacidiphilus sp. MAP5-52 TaxID=3156267 RepID=UPI003516469E
MFDRTDSGSNPPQVRIRLPDGQTLRGAARERHQEADGSWWMLATVTLIVRNLTVSGRLTAEPEPVSFWAPMADGVVTPIEGEDYSAVPTTRDPGLLRRQARARATGQRRRPRDDWA